MNPERAKNELESLLRLGREWLLARATGAGFSLQSNEIEISVEREKLFLGFPGETGFQTWRIVDYQYENEKISLDLTRNFGRENEKISLVPRVSAFDLSQTTELARIEKARKIARMIVESNQKTKLVRVELNRDTGRFAQIIFEDFRGSQIAAVADVSGSLTPEILVLTSVLWLEKLQNRKKNAVENVWILAERKQAKDLSKLHALLRENRKNKIRIFEISRAAAKAQNEELKELPALPMADLWRGKSGKIQTIENPGLSRTARRIIEFAPDEIDVVFSKNGETLRFLGLPFARVRKISGEEKAWFGAEAKRRQLLGEKNFAELVELIEEIKAYRRFDAPNKQHAFYRLAPESWLEAILRKNIKLLDANLILSPLHHQFRAGREQIDLLALRRDGRLVIIELKVAPDRASVFQAADYWRKIELRRRRGNLEKAKIFGDLEIPDAPALVYLVAPSLAFHKDSLRLAQSVAPEIEIYRFDLNENWRENLKVLRREKLATKEHEKDTKDF